MQALLIQELSKTYANGLHALDHISFAVEQGDFFALLGPNGAGKSTTIGILTSLIKKSSGKVWVFGHDIDTDFSIAKTHIGLVPQEFNFNIFETVEQIVMNQAGYYGLSRSLARTRSEYYLKKLGLWEKRGSSARTLSGGMKRRLMIARALIHNPKLLILDEPTAGVDIELRRSMWDFLREINQQGVTIILTTHYLEEAENLCRTIAIINHGRIIEHTQMKSLLQKLDLETFIFYLRNPIIQAPILSDFHTQLIDESTLEISLHHKQNLNTLLSKLDEQGITVSSMRNKSNRLEELFIQLTGK